MGARLISELNDGSTLEAAIERRRLGLRELLAPADAVHALGQVLLSETLIDPNTYSESEHEGLAFVVELVAAELVSRPDRGGSAEVTPALDGRFISSVREFAREAMLLESFRRYRGAGGLASAEAAVRGRAAGQHLMMRAPGWPWQEEATLKGLFGPEHIAKRLREQIGFSAEEAIRCSKAVTDGAQERIAAHMTRARDRIADFGPGSEAHDWAVATLGGWQSAPRSDALKAEALTGLWAMNCVGEALVIDPVSLSDAASVEEDAAEAFLRALSLSFGHPGEDWFAVAERIRFRPYIELADGKYMPTVPSNDLWALRFAFEDALKGFQPYSQHRSKWLEAAGSRLIAEALAADESYQSIDFSYSTGTETVRGEIDGLIRIDDTVLIVEAKGATLRAGARRGGEGFIKHLRENITKAAQQAKKASEALRLGGDGLQRNGEALRLGVPAREAHAVVVTLDDLSPAAPSLWEFAGTKVMPDDVSIPWVVTLHELELVCSTIEWPAQLIHFLRRRAQLNTRGRLRASDELDLWMHYLLKGLYFEEDEDFIRLASHTDALDAWVLFDRGLRSVSAPRPRSSLDATTRAVLTLLNVERPPGWVAASCSLLDPDDSARRKLWSNVARLRGQATRRNSVQRMGLIFDSPSRPFMICSVVVPDDAADLLSHLERYVREQIDEFGSRRVLGFAHRSSSKRPYDAMLLGEHRWWA
jgi:hypothetical protein